MSDHLERVIRGGGKEYVLLFDPCDLQLFESYSWIVAMKDDYPSVRAFVREDGRQKTKIFVRMALGVKNRLVVDHINRNPLDNRRSNLRICSIGENIWNCGPHPGRKYKGTCLDRKTMRWRASIRVKGKAYYSAFFDTEEESAREYDILSRKHHREFAYQNFPDLQPSKGEELLLKPKTRTSNRDLRIRIAAGDDVAAELLELRTWLVQQEQFGKKERG